jgi:hypothetical protein
MEFTRRDLFRSSVAALVAGLVGHVASAANDPLPSWNDNGTKKSVEPSAVVRIHSVDRGCHKLIPSRLVIRCADSQARYASRYHGTLITIILWLPFKSRSAFRTEARLLCKTRWYQFLPKRCQSFPAVYVNRPNVRGNFQSESQGFLNDVVPVLNRQDDQGRTQVIQLQWGRTASFYRHGVVVATNKNHREEEPRNYEHRYSSALFGRLVREVQDSRIQYVVLQGVRQL